MISFTLERRSKRSRARLGRLRTPHGAMETPALVPVATQAVVKTLTSEEVRRTGTRALIANAFHLHLRPGERTVARHGGLHRFMHWHRALMTDSAGFQVFSLGFGYDAGHSKMLRRPSRARVEVGQQPQRLTLTDRHVTFRSPIDGRLVKLGPRESIRIQEALGADIMFAFDECPPPTATQAYVRTSLERTHRWAVQSLAARRTKQALFGIVQGGRFTRLRTASACFIGSLPFDGFGIGGEFGHDKAVMGRMIGSVNAILPEDKPRHLLGIGHPEDLRRIVAAGVDTFDCIAPTHYARRGAAFTSRGRLDCTQTARLRDRRPLDPACSCEVCTTYSRSYIAHLFRAKEITAMRLVTFHNLFYFNALVADLRRQIRAGQL